MANKTPTKVFLIVGSGRCGTTLMRSILEKHPQMNVFRNEPHYMRELHQRFGDFVTDVPNAVQFVLANDKFRPQWVEPNVILSAFKGQREVKFSEFFFFFYGLYFDDYAAKPLIIKDPHLVQNLDMAKNVFCQSEVRVVHVIRDPRAVANSFKARWKNHSALSASIGWRDAVRSGQQWGRNNSPSYLEIRYEDLVNDPENTIGQVCDFLSVQYHSCLMDLNYNVNSWNVDGKGQATNTNFKGFDASKLDNWRSHLTAEDIAIIERTCRAEMPNRGYPLMNAKPNAWKFAMRYNKEMLTYSKSKIGKSLYSSKNAVGRFLRQALRSRRRHGPLNNGK